MTVLETIGTIAVGLILAGGVGIAVVYVLALANGMGR